MDLVARSEGKLGMKGCYQKRKTRYWLLGSEKNINGPFKKLKKIFYSDLASMINLHQGG